GEFFDDLTNEKVRLTAAHVYPKALGGKATASDLVTACQRCNEALQQHTENYLTADQVMARIRVLGSRDRTTLRKRVATGRRETDQVDAVWRSYLQLPGAERSRIEEELNRLP